MIALQTAGPVGPLHWLFGLLPSEASFESRGFRAVDPCQKGKLEAIGAAFIHGYNAALRTRDARELRRVVDGIPPDLRGFAAEGAAMGTVIADAFGLRRARLASVLDLLRPDFDYLAHVGLGWALARVPWRARALRTLLDPVHCWLVQDGIGFHDAYFRSRKILSGWKRLKAGYAARAYDQGVGRALWFIGGGDVRAAVHEIRSLRPERSEDLWAGLGLAIAYAGTPSFRDVEHALELAGRHRPAFQQGVAFAAEARARAGHVPAHTEEVAHHCTGSTAAQLAHMVRAARNRLLPAVGSEPAYQLWRRQVAEQVRAKDRRHG